MGEKTINENESSTKSLDDLLSKKKSKETNDKTDNNEDMRQKMNRIVGANKVFENEAEVTLNKQDEYKMLVSEKRNIEKELKEANKKLRTIYNLKYEEQKVIDKKKNDLSVDFLTAIQNQTQTNSLLMQNDDFMSEELSALQKEIRTLQSNNEAARHSFEEATAAANLAQEAAMRACTAFEEKEKSNTRRFKEEITRLQAELNQTNDILKKAEAEKNAKNNQLEKLKQDNKASLDNIKQLKSQITKDQKEIENTKTKIQACNDNIKALTKEKKDLETKVQEQDNSINTISLENTEYKNKLVEVEKSLDDTNSLLETLKKDNETLTAESTKAKQDLEDLINEKNIIEENCNTLKKELEEKDNNINSLNEKINEMDKEKNAKIEEYNALQAKYDEEIIIINQKLEEQKQKDLEFNQLLDEYNTLQEKYDLEKQTSDKAIALEEQLNEALKEQEKLKELEEKLEETKKLQEEKEQEFNSLQEQFYALELNAEKDKELSEKLQEEKDQDYKKLQKEYEELEEKIQDADEENEEEFNKLQEENDSLKEQLENINNIQTEKENELLKLQEENTSLKEEIESNNSTQTEKENELLKLQEENTSLKEELDSKTILEEENNNLKTELDAKSILEEENTSLKEELDSKKALEILKEEEITKLQEENNQLKTILEEKNNLQVEEEKELNTLKEQINEENNTNDEKYVLLKADYDKLVENTIPSDQEEQYTNQIKALQEEIDRLNNELITTNNRIKELEESNNKENISVISSDSPQAQVERNAILKVMFYENNQLPLEEQKSEEDIKAEFEKQYIKTIEVVDDSTDENQSTDLLKKAEYEKTIDNLYVQIDDKDDIITVLKQENNKLSFENRQIEELQNKIQTLESRVGNYTVTDSDLNNTDNTIDESVFKELQELQNECDRNEEELAIIKQKKEEVEEELNACYDALKEQTDILDQQQDVIEKQQFVIDQKFIIYKTQEKYYFEQIALFNKYKESYDKDRETFNEQKVIAEERRNVIYKSEYTIDEYQKKISELECEIDDDKEEIEILKEEQVKHKKIIKQYLNDIEVSEKLCSEYADSYNSKEAEIKALNEQIETINKEYNEYKNQKEAEINSLKEEIINIKKTFSEISTDSEKLEISKFNESRLQSRIFELENNIKMLSIKQDSSEDTTTRTSLNQYRVLLENERIAHNNSEDILANDLKKVRTKVDEAEDKLIKYSSNYMFTVLNNQIGSVTNIINNIKNNGTDFNRDIYSDYYEESLRIYYEQRKVYNKEIEKRNEILSIIKNDLTNEIESAKNEAQLENNDSPLNNKLRQYIKDIKDIDNILNSKIKSYTPVDSKIVEEEILRNFKNELIAYHKQIEDNITLLEHHIDEKYNDINALDNLMDVYKTDCDEMAKRYSEEIIRLNTENKFDNNEFTKLIREEKILMLANEFQNLIVLRNQKYEATQNKLEKEAIEANNNEYNNSLASFDNLKKNLSAKLDSLKQEEEKIKQLLYEEENQINEDINSLNDQILRLDKFADDDEVKEDKRKASVLLAGKKERLDYLNDVKIIEIENHYEELIKGVKEEYNKVLQEETDVKETFAKREDLIKASKNMTINQSQNENRINTFTNINRYLLDLNSLDSIISSIIIKRRNNSAIAKENKQNAANDLIAKYQNMWTLYQKYSTAKKIMEEDFEDIRTYNNLKLDANSNYRKYVTTTKEITLVNERTKSGIDTNENQDNIKSLTIKSNNYKSRVDYLNNQASLLLKNSNVNEYVELVNKMEQIINIIKQLGLQINTLE